MGVKFQNHHQSEVSTHKLYIKKCFKLLANVCEKILIKFIIIVKTHLQIILPQNCQLSTISHTITVYNHKYDSKAQ